MGGDFIGSDLVPLSTGIDLLKAVIDIALGIEPSCIRNKNSFAAVRFILSKEDLLIFEEIKIKHPELIVRSEINTHFNETVTDSSTRNGYYILQSNSPL